MAERVRAGLGSARAKGENASGDLRKVVDATVVGRLRSQ